MSASTRGTDTVCVLPVFVESAVRPRAELRAEVSTAIGAGERRIAVDCQGWNQLDLGLVGTFVQVAKLCADGGVEFALVNVSGTMTSTIRALRLEDHLPITSDQRAA